MPGSHRPPFYDHLDRLNHIQSRPEETPFGVAGPDLPGYALEVEPGDAVFFNQHLYHAVFGKQADRRYIALKFAAKPTTPRHFEGLRKHGALLLPPRLSEPGTTAHSSDDVSASG